MNILSPWFWLILIVILASACGSTAYVTHKYTADSYQIQIDQANAKASDAKDKLDKAKATYETQLKDKTDEIDRDYKSQVAKISSDRDYYKRLFTGGARLRANTDQSGAGSASGNSSTTSGSGGTGPVAAILSSTTSDALFSIAAGADHVSAQLAACQAWAKQVEDTMSKWQADSASAQDQKANVKVGKPTLLSH